MNSKKIFCALGSFVLVMGVIVIGNMIRGNSFFQKMKMVNDYCIDNLNQNPDKDSLYYDYNIEALVERIKDENGVNISETNILDYVSQSVEISTENIETEVFPKAEKISMENHEETEVETAESESIADDLVFRNFTWGLFLEKGYEILIERDQIADEAENGMSIVILLDGNVYEEIPLDSGDDKDIVFTLEKSGDYVFWVIDADGNSVDITSTVMIMKSADKGVILLLY